MPNKIIKKEKAEEVKNENWDLSYDTKTLITILMLVAVYPVGLVLMLVWMKWSKWVKALVALPVLFMLLVPIFIFLVLIMVAIRVLFQPSESIKTFDMVREKIQQETVVSPTIMMISPTVRVIKK